MLSSVTRFIGVLFSRHGGVATESRLAEHLAQARAFIRDTKQPEAAQDRVWREIWNDIRDAEHWRRAGRAPALEEFELTVYDDYRPALEASFPQTISKL